MYTLWEVRIELTFFCSQSRRITILPFPRLAVRHDKLVEVGIEPTTNGL
jgi:hypothetical protein